MPPRVGAHMSIAGGMERAVERAVAAGCEALQVFTRNASQWAAKPFAPGEPERFRAAVDAAGLHPVMAHDSYLINVGSPDEALWTRSLAALDVELQRCAALGVRYLVMHPGSHVGAGEAAAIERIACALDELHARHGREVTILLENTAGQGTNVGHRFEHLAAILERTKEPDRVGVCIDTSHAWAAGYDLGTDAGWDATWGELDRVLGLARVRALHVNDSKKPQGSRVDRHEHIGLGEMGPGPFWRLMNDPRFDGLPASLETEKDDDLRDDVRNLAALRALRGLPAPPDAAQLRAWREDAVAAFVPPAGTEPAAGGAAKKKPNARYGR